MPYCFTEDEYVIWHWGYFIKSLMNIRTMKKAFRWNAFFNDIRSCKNG